MGACQAMKPQPMQMQLLELQALEAQALQVKLLQLQPLQIAGSSRWSIWKGLRRARRGGASGMERGIVVLGVRSMATIGFRGRI